MLNDTPQWVALYTNPRAEKATAAHLKSLGYETYLPLERKLHRWSDRWKSVEVPLITSYLFVKIRGSDVVNIRAAKGVSFIVSWHGQPGIIPDSEIEGIRRLMDAEAEVKVMNDSELKKGAHVRIIEGQFAGLEGFHEAGIGRSGRFRVRHGRHRVDRLRSGAGRAGKQENQQKNTEPGFHDLTPFYLGNRE